MPSAPLQQGCCRAVIPGAILRVPALALDALVLEQLMPLLVDPRFVAPFGWPQAAPALKRVEVRADTIEIIIDRAFLRKGADVSSLVPEPANPGRLRLTVLVRFKLRGGRNWLLPAKGGSATVRARPDLTLIKGLRAAHRIAKAAAAYPVRQTPALRGRVLASSYERNLCALAFLAPDIQAAIMDGRQPYDLNLERLIKTDLPLAWADQRRLLGFPAR